METYFKEIWKWIKTYSWVITLVSALINIADKVEVTNVINNIWSLIHSLNHLTPLQLIFFVSAGITVYVFIRFLFDARKTYIQCKTDFDNVVKKIQANANKTNEEISKWREEFNKEILEWRETTIKKYPELQHSIEELQGGKISKAQKLTGVIDEIERKGNEKKEK